MSVAASADNKKAQASMQFLRTSYNPIVYNTAPPIDSSRSDILKDVTIQCQFTIPTATPIGEGISFQQGMILWLVKRGLTSLYRMAFVPQGAVSTYQTLSSPLFRGLTSAIVNLYPSAYSAGAALGGVFTTCNVVDQIGSIGSITYQQELAIPVGAQTGEANLIQITPSISGSITFSRVYAGITEVYSSTVSIGNTTLAGTFSAASISDTRDVAQSPQGAYSITNIVQSSETTKDAIMQAPSDQGVVTLVACDIQDRFTNPNQEQVLIYDGNWVVFPLTQYVNPSYQQLTVVPAEWPGPTSGSTYSTTYPASAVPAGTATGTALGNQTPLGNIWITPWATTASSRINVGTPTSYPAGFATTIQLQTPTIAETGMLRFRIYANFFITPGLLNQPVAASGDLSIQSAEMGALVTHVFATANLDGTIQYQTFVEKKVAWSGSAIAGQSGGTRNFSTMDFDPTLFFVSFLVTGKYIGSYVTLYGTPTAGPYSNAGTVFSETTAGTVTASTQNSWAYLTYNITNLTVAVVAPDIDVDGNTGPARIVRWDAMSTGMQVDIAGKLWAQIIPSSAIMPYVKAQQMNRTRYVPENAERFVKRVYNSSGTLLRRVWNLKAYKEFLAGAAKDISTETVFDWARKDENVEEAAYAAGIFGSLGSGGSNVPSLLASTTASDAAMACGDYGRMASGGFQTQGRLTLPRQRAEGIF